ncbi:alpha/beta hydrolase [Rathayibacter soli]|uniref:alpha/beta hydrolase n=1 Tax=Rathayibacter soli TaxID=3144168 RepID=UPI0027E4CB92|nr:alpha/beta hydrolase-fold protein [Glaciibacter superstes]
MLDWLLDFRIDKSAFLVPVDVVAALLFVYLLVRRPSRRWLITAIAAVVLGAAVGWLITWLVSDVWDVFGLPVTTVVRVWVAMTCAGIFLAVLNLIRTRWWRKLIAALSIIVFVVAAAAAINVDFGAYRNLKDALGITPYPPLASSHLSGQAGPMDPTLAQTWQPPAGMPSKGTVGTVDIPATTSGFSARVASVYLPPAALVPSAPKLPVMVMFSGQPGAPADLFTSGQLQGILDAYAAAHNGLAPIVVAPDQLGNPLSNPMCVDSTLGKSGTYLTVDVPHWITSHLNVADGPQQWAVGGYSQGGTCALQFGAGYPNLYRSFIDISGEIAPTIGRDTVKKAFGGSAAAYNAIKPLTLLAKHAPYTDTVAIFGVGAQDAKYVPITHAAMQAATAAGMTTDLIRSPNSSHDWNTVRYVLSRAVPAIATRMGL